MSPPCLLCTHTCWISRMRISRYEKCFSGFTVVSPKIMDVDLFMVSSFQICSVSAVQSQYEPWAVSITNLTQGLKIIHITNIISVMNNKSVWVCSYCYPVHLDNYFSCLFFSLFQRTRMVLSPSAPARLTPASRSWSWRRSFTTADI